MDGHLDLDGAACVSVYICSRYLHLYGQSSMLKAKAQRGQ